MSEQQGTAEESEDGVAAQAETPAVDVAAPAADGTPTAADLAELIGDKSDDDVNQLITDFAGEGDGLIAAIFEGMEQRFLPDKAAGKSAVIQYDITLPDSAQSWQVVVGDGKATTTKAGDKEPNVTLVLASADFLRVISGKLNGVQAFMSGKLKVKGDMMLAQTMQGWFDQG